MSYRGSISELRCKIQACIFLHALELGTVAVLLMSFNKTQAADGYEATGHFTYTAFDDSGNPTFRNVMMFDVKVANGKWHVRTEPVIEGKGGIGFYEASNGTNGFILSITALETAYLALESPFNNLREAIKASKKEDVYFANHEARLPMPAAYSNLFSSPDQPAKKQSVTNKIDNVAVGMAVNGKFPPVDPSYIALLWFAFTPIEAQEDGTNKMLLQVWDDGNRTKTRLRRANWKLFSEYPHLVSNAVYFWRGKNLLPNGDLTDINVSDVNKPSEIAARYEVENATNSGGLMLPLNFKLTRFSTKWVENTEPKIISTVVASVVKVSHLSSEAFLEVRIPGKTFISDYRLSSGELGGTPLGYIFDSNAPPSVENLKKGGLYKRTSEIAKASAAKSYIRPAFIIAFFVSSLALLIFWRSTAQSRKNGD